MGIFKDMITNQQLFIDSASDELARLQKDFQTHIETAHGTDLQPNGCEKCKTYSSLILGQMIQVSAEKGAMNDLTFNLEIIS